MVEMARFFFHFLDGETTSNDEWGLDLNGPEEAYLEAVAAARSMWPELLAARRDPTRCAFEVTGEGGEELFRLDFSELLDECRASPPAPAPPDEILRLALEETRRHARTGDRSCARSSMASASAAGGLRGVSRRG
jgi:hypothetical protein